MTHLVDIGTGSPGRQQDRQCLHCVDFAGMLPGGEDGACPRIHLFTFGGLRAVGPAGPIPLSPRHRHLMRWLALAAWGPPLAVDTVCDALWPNVDGAAAASNFASTVRRLRMVLGNRAAIVVEGGSVGLDPRHCHVDLGLVRHLLCLPALVPDTALGATAAAHCAQRLLAATEGDNPVLMAVPSGGDMALRIQALVGAWRQVTLHLTGLLDSTPGSRSHDPALSALALRLCERIERHGWADDRIRARWHFLSAARQPVRELAA